MPCYIFDYYAKFGGGYAKLGDCKVIVMPSYHYVTVMPTYEAVIPS